MDETQETVYTYDNIGQIINIEDRLGENTGKQYDADDRLTQNKNITWQNFLFGVFM